MTKADRIAFLRKHGFGLGMLIVIYVLLTIIRSVRDDFAVEIWQWLSGQEMPAVFAKSETLVMFGVVIVNGLAIAIKDNRTAFLSALWLIVAGFAIVLISLFGFRYGLISPFPFMVLIGFGMYVPYVAYHTTIFERLIATTRDVANIGYLMYLADALGYLSYIGVMVYRHLTTSGEIEEFIFKLFTGISLVISVFSIALCAILIVYFGRRISRDAEH